MSRTLKPWCSPALLFTLLHGLQCQRNNTSSGANVNLNSDGFIGAPVSSSDSDSDQLAMEICTIPM